MIDAGFIDRQRPAPRGGGFAMDGYWVWCGSCVRGDDGRHHLFASRWPREMAFSPNWLTNSEVVRAVADDPLGPYAFEEVLLPPRGPKFWDGRMTHNPTVHRAPDGTCLLYYTGTTYADPLPRPGEQVGRWGTGLAAVARANQRVGLATSRSVFGPWQRPDRPLIEPRPGRWDGLMTTNPAPCVAPDGSVLLAYKSTRDQGDKLRYGVAAAAHYAGPYERVADEPVFRFDDPRQHIEDAYVWREAGRYHLVMKDMEGGIGGEKGGGVHATSDDGRAWRLADDPRAYSRAVRFDDGTTTTFGHRERPQLLVDPDTGLPTHLFTAVGDGPGGFEHFTRTYNLAVPLATRQETR